MPFSAEEVAVILRLQGAQEYNAQMQESAASTREMGAAGAEAGAEASAGMSKATAAGAAATTGMGRNAKRMKTIGATMTKWVTVPAVAVAAVSSKMALDFHESMSLIETQAGASAKEVQKQSKNILAFAASGQTASGPKELAEALFQVESAGYRGAKAFKVLRASSDLAIVSQTKVADTTQSVVSAMKSGIKGGQDLKQAIGTLNATVGAGRMHMQDLNSAISTGALSAFRAMGVSLPNVGAALATLTNQGQPAAASMTRLRMAMTMMVAGGDKQQQVLKTIGLTTTELGNTMRGPRGLLNAMQLLHDHLEGMTHTERFQTISGIFGARSAQAILALVDDTKTLGSNLDHINESSGNVNEKLAAAKADPATKLHQAWAKLQAVLVRLGDKLLPVVVPLIQSFGNALGKVFSAFAGLPAPVQRFIGYMVVLGAMAGPVIKLTLKILELRAAIIGLGIAQGEAGAASAGGSMLSSTGSMAAGGLRAARSGLMLGAGAYAAGNIATSAANKDYRDAGFELGGSVIGGIVGSFAGPEGTMIGIAAGNAIGEAVAHITKGEKKLKPGQAAMAGSAKRTAEAFQHQAGAAKHLEYWTKQAAAAHKHHVTADHQLHQAEVRLAKATKEYGFGSRQATKATLALARAKHKDASASRADERAQHLHGAQLKLYRKTATDSVKTEHNRIAVLKLGKKHIDAQINSINLNKVSQKTLNDLQSRSEKNSQKLGKATGQLKQTLATAAKEGGDKFYKSLKQIHGPQAQFNAATAKGHTLLDLAGGSISKANRMLQAQNGNLKTTVRLWQQYNDAVSNAGQFGPVSGAVTTVPQAPDISPPGQPADSTHHHPAGHGGTGRIMPRRTLSEPRRTNDRDQGGQPVERHHHVYIGAKEVAHAVATESENRAARR